MTLPRPKLPELDADKLPRVAMAGVALALAALLLAGVAVWRVVVVSATKADKASAASIRASDEARTGSLLVVCAAVDAQREGNPNRPPATSELAKYSGRAWQAVYVRAGCDRFTPEQLAAAIDSAQTVAPRRSPSLTPTPSPS